jgi:predicted GIY-YIG superfamily endonuclease
VRGVYLLHFASPFGLQQHYVGWSSDVDRRVAHHLAGDGGEFTRSVFRRGIVMTLAASWPGEHAYELWLKKHGPVARFCPLCSPDGYLLPPFAGGSGPYVGQRAWLARRAARQASDSR